MPPSTIPLRKLGDRLVPAIGLGLMGAGGAYGSVDSTANRLQVRSSYQMLIGILSDTWS